MNTKKKVNENKRDETLDDAHFSQFTKNIKHKQ